MLTNGPFGLGCTNSSLALRKIRSLAPTVRLGIVLLLALHVLSAPGAEDQAWSRLFIPFPIYSPETGVALTLTGMGLYRAPDATQTSSLLVFGSYSQRRQGMFNVAPQLVLRDETLWVEAFLSYKDWPDRFFGVGHATPRKQEESYTARTAMAALTLRQALVSQWSAGLQVRYADYGIKDLEPGGLLARATDPGSQGIRVGGLGLQAVWDSRDDRFAPERGVRFELAGMLFEHSDAGGAFQRIRLDARRYLPTGDYGTLALQSYINATFGAVPFQALSRIGDLRAVGLMRGYYSGRYLDRHVAVLQAEWRVPLYKRFGAVLFGSIGAIGEDLLCTGRHSRYAAGGGGLRYRATGGERINLRLDVAFGEEQPGVYFSIMEAF